MSDAELDDRASIIAYVRKVASCFQSYGYSEKHGQEKANQMSELLMVLADDIQERADRQENW